MANCRRSRRRPYFVNEGATVQQRRVVRPDGTIATFLWDVNYNGVTLNRPDRVDADVRRLHDGPATRTVAAGVIDDLGKRPRH